MKIFNILVVGIATYLMQITLRKGTLREFGGGVVDDEGILLCTGFYFYF